MNIEKALRDFADPTSLHETLRKLPPSAPTPLVLDALVHFLGQTDTQLGVLVTTLKKQKPAMLALLQKRLTSDVGPRAVFLSEYLRVAGDSKWPQAIDALQSMRAVGRDAKGRKVAAALAKDLAAATACAALVHKRGHDWFSQYAIQVLIFNETELGLDALAPIVDELDQFDRELIEKWAPKDSPVTKLVTQRQQAKRKASNAVAWVKQAGIDVEDFDFWLQLRSEAGAQFLVAATDSGMPWFQCVLSVNDPTKPEYARPKTSYENFGTKDDLGVGIPAPEGFDVWFQNATKKLAIIWLWEEAMLRTSLRGKARNKLVAWLRGS
jgi:hypothetical protein